SVAEARVKPVDVLSAAFELKVAQHLVERAVLHHEDDDVIDLTQVSVSLLLQGNGQNIFACFNGAFYGVVRHFSPASLLGPTQSVPRVVRHCQLTAPLTTRHSLPNPEADRRVRNRGLIRSAATLT